MADPPAATADATPFLVTNRVRRLGGAILPVARIPLGATQGSKKSTMVAGAKGTYRQEWRSRVSVAVLVILRVATRPKRTNAI